MITTLDRSIDLRLVAPSDALPQLSFACESLAVGASVAFTLDHSPRFMHYHMSSRYPDIFVWRILDLGPLAWRVRVTRRPPRCVDESPEALVERDTTELRTVTAFLREDVEHAALVPAPDLRGVRMRLERLGRLSARFLASQNDHFLPAVELEHPRLFEGPGRVLRLQLEKVPDLIGRVERALGAGFVDDHALAVSVETLRELDLLLGDVARREESEYFGASRESIAPDARRKLALELRLVG